MTENLISNDKIQDECFGYFFHVPMEGLEWGSPQLDVNLRGDPTGRHYDPEQLRLRTINKDQRIEYSKIYHPWPGESQLKVAVGDIVLRDRKEKTIEVFTFGGVLKIERSGECTKCSILSPVPIIDLRDDHLETHLLAQESKALIAQRRIDWDKDLEGFEERIAETDAQRLYYGILRSLEVEFRNYPKDDRINTQDFLQFLERQIEIAESMFDPIHLPGSIEAIV
jgi:hypothetical protein